nr:ATP-binding protein [Pseudodesulfovibrio sp.]
MKVTFLLRIHLLLFIVLATSPALAAESLRISIFPFSPPFSYYAVQNGNKYLQGYTIDESLAVGKELKQDIEFIAVSAIDRQIGILKKGDIALIAHDSASYAKTHGLTFIPVGVSLQHHLYIHEACAPCIDLHSPETLRNKRVVTVKGAPYVMDISKVPNIIEAPSALEALNLLNQGIADIYIAPSERVADYLIVANGFDAVLKDGDFIGEAPLGFIVNPDDTELISRLKTAIKTLERQGTLASIRDKWFDQPHEFSLSKYSKQIALTALGIATLFVMFGVWNLSLKRRVAQVARDLRQTEQRYRDLIESSPDMIFLVTEDGEILHANERACTNLRLKTPFKGLNLQNLIAPEDKEEVAPFLDKVFNDGCDKFEFRMDEKTRQDMEVEIAGRILQGPIQPGLLACLFARNVTDRNRMEEELIQSERLGIIGKMAAGVAHEINNPLGIIQFNAEDMLYAEEMSTEAREGLTAISRNAARAADTITHLLDLASPKPMANDILHLDEAVKDCIALLGPKIKKTTLTLDIQNEPLSMRGDSRAIQQVLVNLLLNALSSMQGKRSISIFGDRSHESIRLVIEDKGKGIVRKDLPHIFDPFFTSRENGFGLGLFITRRIVERHGGIIFAESEPDKGTRMILEFPLHEDEESV